MLTLFFNKRKKYYNGGQKADYLDNFRAYWIKTVHHYLNK